MRFVKIITYSQYIVFLPLIINNWSAIKNVVTMAAVHNIIPQVNAKNDVTPMSRADKIYNFSHLDTNECFKYQS